MTAENNLAPVALLPANAGGHFAPPLTVGPVQDLVALDYNGFMRLFCAWRAYETASDKPTDSRLHREVELLHLHGVFFELRKFKKKPTLQKVGALAAHKYGQYWVLLISKRK